MSRTWRNRKTVPKDLKVRDGRGWIAFDKEDNEYYFNSYSGVEFTWDKYRFYPYFGYQITYPTMLEPTMLDSWRKTILSDQWFLTEKRYVKKFRESIYSKEIKWWRKLDRGRIRTRERDLMKKGRWEEIPIEKKSCGWNTW